MDWAAVHKIWDKWASNNFGCSDQHLKAALLLNYDPNGPSRLLSAIVAQEGIKADLTELGQIVNFVKSNKLQTESFYLRQNQYFMKNMLKKFIKNFHQESSLIGNFRRGFPSELPEVYLGWKESAYTLLGLGTITQDLVTSIHETWFCARCMNTSKPAGEGVIVMQTAAFLLIGLYEGSIGPSSHAMVALDQLACQLSRRNL